MSEELTVSQADVFSALPTRGDNVFQDKDAFNQLARVSEAFSKTALVPDNYRGKPADCMVAIDMANRLNVPPLMVMQNLYVVKGKPSWSGQACTALIQGCGKFQDVKHIYTGQKGTDVRGCFVQATRISDGTQIDGVEVTLQMARDEGWINNPKWKHMPELMLAYRAAAFFARVNCPEALMGVHVEGEVDDIKPDRAPVKNPFVVNDGKDDLL